MDPRQEDDVNSGFGRQVELIRPKDCAAFISHRHISRRSSAGVRRTHRRGGCTDVTMKRGVLLLRLALAAVSGICW
jgi:hypothetical protein